MKGRGGGEEGRGRENADGVVEEGKAWMMEKGRMDGWRERGSVEGRRTGEEGE